MVGERDLPGWLEPVARAGYAAKGTVYALVGGLALWESLTHGGRTTGGHGALRELAQAPLGRLLVGVLAAGLVGFLAWRLVQSLADPEGMSERDGWVGWAKRFFYLFSALIYGGLALFAVQLLVGSGDSGGGGGGRISEFMSMPGGRWLVAAAGIGVVVRGVYQFVKVFTDGFRERIREAEIPREARRWVLGVSRFGLSARGLVFVVVGTAIVWAMVTRDPEEALTVDGLLDSLRGEPWLLGAIGAGLLAYAVYEWTRARYRVIGV